MFVENFKRYIYVGQILKHITKQNIFAMNFLHMNFL